MSIQATIVTARNVRIDCLITNLSEIGALLIVPSVLGIPDEFELVVPRQFSRIVCVARRGRAFLGVRFARPLTTTIA